MTKEMFVSSTPHETKVAVVEDDQLAEIFFERENEYTLAGSIYKGRVTRVLPGMQSAFVDIGLERDAFLYVSDFLDLEEEDEEFEQLPVRPEAYVNNKPQPEPKAYDFHKDAHRFEAPPMLPAHGAAGEEDESADEPLGDFEGPAETANAGGDEQGDRNGFRGRRRRRGRRGRGFPDSKFARGGQREEPRQETPGIAEDFAPAPHYDPIVLPGESISKYRRPEPPAQQARPGGQASYAEPASTTTAAASAGEPFVIEGGFDSSEAMTEFAEPAGRGEPELAVEATRAPETDSGKAIPAGVDLPFVLPGESISKYKRGEELEREVAAQANEIAAPELAAAPAPELPSFVRPMSRARDVGAPSTPAPFVLPGESIAKYRTKPEPQSTPVQEQPQAVAATVQEAADEPVAAERMVDEANQPSDVAEMRADDSGHAHSDLPVDAPVAASVEEKTIEEKPKAEQEGPRTDVRMERRSGVAPFILPGESIAKYRKRPRVPEPEEQSHAHELQEEIQRQPEERLAETAAHMVSDNEPLSVTLDRELEREAGEQEQHAEEHIEPLTGEHGSLGGTTEPADDFQDVDPEQRNAEQRYEQTEVVSTFDGESAEGFSNGADDLADEGHRPEAIAGNDAAAAAVETGESSVEQRHGYSAGAGHTLEQEEIEDEESEYRPYSEDDEQDTYVELEEETLEPSASGRNRRHDAGMAGRPEQIEGANGLTDNVHEAMIDEETRESAYPEDTALDEDEGEECETADEGAEEDEDEFEESELEADAAEGHGAAPSHAGERPVTGYPQRPSRPGYDRRPGRGRRGDRGGGRRMRGGPGPRREPRVIPLISDLLKEGQEVLIQIAKEPIGKKGARITSHIALPGRYLVYMPTVNHIGVSRKINSDEERQRLKRIMLSEREGGHGGFIVRTAAEGITEEELRADIRFLKNLWHDIKTRSENSKAPALIYHDLNLVERVLRDQVTADFSAIWVDTESEYERILRFAQRFQPQLVRKVKLYTKNTPLYEQFGIKDEIDKALKSKVWLKSGGYIVINQTEALVAIDINTGKYVGKTARLEDTIVKTNVDAIKEIVRQIRLRDLGGIIVIDFIDMDERKNRQRVMQALEEAMKSDRAPSKVLAFNDFGLVAITRKRVKQSLERTLGEPCPYCTGTGLVKSVNTMCNEIYLEMRKMAPHMERGDVVLRVNPDVAKALKENGGKWIQEMEDLTRKNILVKSDPLVHQETFDIQA